MGSLGSASLSFWATPPSSPPSRVVYFPRPRSLSSSNFTSQPRLASLGSPSTFSVSQLAPSSGRPCPSYEVANFPFRSPCSASQFSPLGQPQGKISRPSSSAAFSLASSAPALSPSLLLCSRICSTIARAVWRLRSSQ